MVICRANLSRRPREQLKLIFPARRSPSRWILMEMLFFLPLLENNAAKHQNLTLVSICRITRTFQFLGFEIILIKFVFLVVPMRSGLSLVVNYHSIKRTRNRIKTYYDFTTTILFYLTSTNTVSDFFYHAYIYMIRLVQIDLN